MANKNEVLAASKGLLLATEKLMKGKRGEAARMFANLVNTPAKKRGMVDIVKAVSDATVKMVENDNEEHSDNFDDLDNDMGVEDEKDDVNVEDDETDESEVVTAFVRKALRSIKKRR